MSPSAPLRPCLEPRCPNLVTAGGPGRGRCPQHARAHVRAYEAVRGNARARGYDSRWARYSKALRRQHPLCGMRPPEAPVTPDSVCLREGRTTPGELTDHIRPVTGPHDPGFFDPSNHQVLCWHCHQLKRARERHGAR